MSLFDDLVRRTNAVVRRDEAFIACPECGKESSPANVHFSFSPRGCYCFTCGYKASLSGLATRLGVGERDDITPPVRRPEPERKPAAWLADAGQLVRGYTAHAHAWELWQSYKPVSRETTRRYRLGVGVLPVSRCRHERLIVPIYFGTEIRGLRGRAISCDCPKWLAPGGTDIRGMYPLYNQDAIVPGCTIWIVENPVDALLVGERTPYVGVATYSVSYWFERWTEALRSADCVIVAYDNDLPGNGGGLQRAEFERAWLAGHLRTPPAAGPRLANRLRQAGLNAVLYDWGRAPVKADIGSLLMGAA